MIEWLRFLFRDEPVLILAAVQAAITLVVSFGLSLEPEQIGAIVAFTGTVLSLIARRRVTPA
jgi:hypothetical protein